MMAGGYELTASLTSGRGFAADAEGAVSGPEQKRTTEDDALTARKAGMAKGAKHLPPASLLSIDKGGFRLGLSVGRSGINCGRNADQFPKIGERQERLF